MNEVAIIESDVSALEGLDPASREIAITQLLGQAKQFMEVAMSQPDAPRIMADFKAQIITIAEYAKQKRMSEELQIDATAMVRRSERGLGVAIREGQERGEIARQGQGGGNPPGSKGPRSDTNMSLPRDFAPQYELSSNGAGIYHMTDDVTDSEFNAALDVAKEERNLSRANVVRKIREVKGESEVKPARAQSLNTAKTIERLTESLWGLRQSLQTITAIDAELDQGQVAAWIKELSATSAELNRIKNLLKESK